MATDPLPLDDIARHALTAMEVSRTTGAPFLACLRGVTSVPDTPAIFELCFDPAVTALGAGVGLLDVAMLADLAIGGALRSRLGVTRTMPTVTMTLQMNTTQLSSDVSVRAWDCETEGHLVGACANVICTGRAVGRALATFASSDRLPQSTPMPWEADQSHHSAPYPADHSRNQLSADDRNIVDAVQRAAWNAGTVGVAWTQELLNQACAAHCEEDVQEPSRRAIRLWPSVAVLNRAGYVQGAVLFALAGASAIDLVTPVRARVVSATMDFVSAADRSLPVDAVAVLVRSTSRLFFVQVELRQGEHMVVAVATSVLARDE